MKEKLIFTLCLILLLFAFSVSVEAEEIRISAAASLTDAVKDIIAVYQQNHAESQLLPNFASSGALAKQISAGAPADIYISANSKWMQYLQQQGLIDDPSEQVLVQNRLVFVGMPGTAKSMADLPGLQRIAIGSPKATPVGRYSEQAMKNAGIYAHLQNEQKLILAKDVRQALLYADRGEVDGAFVYHTDALLAKQAKVLFAVPQKLYPAVVYPAALTVTGAGKPEAKVFFAYLFSSLSQGVFRTFGFVIPEE
ncbi:molybdate transport system substrate-binding protein [Malonomonas rubra DSM 5091]|uniref:Molybdate transport system substrate-binding protein n=1 Tax=Malonomonas rubra DSM 5091 TaxID=1122189 RepID=A0A1M6N3Q5_MALRU|nr:molybdate ABC transporter substrate-binding protein [Malonomonas rubra]SHJ90288.1 molybdate transport system substrate-binding protein [Malonomonas rubra DSM 5091]